MIGNNQKVSALEVDTMDSVTSIFLVDIDGVACDHVKGICEMVNRAYDQSFQVEDVTAWDYDFGPINFIEAVNKYFSNQNFLLNLEVYDGFNEFIEQLKNMMIVKFATSRSEPKEATRIWVNKNIGQFEVYFVKDKTKIEFDFLLEDYPLNAIAAAEKGKTSFVINRPWNNSDKIKKKLDQYNQIYFVKSYDDVLQQLRLITK
jgi:5'(3')-deoxyribonucleotidase